MLEKLVSGGQTGVDRAALDAALAAGLACGGWCPAGRRAEDGLLDARYPLDETPSTSYRQRTEWNVRDSDGTLILYRAALTGGTRLTVDLAKSFGRPLLVLVLPDASVDAALKWIVRSDIRTLNIAGPRGEGDLTLYPEARSFVAALIAAARA